MIVPLDGLKQVVSVQPAGGGAFPPAQPEVTQKTWLTLRVAGASWDTLLSEPIQQLRHLRPQLPSLPAS